MRLTESVRYATHNRRRSFLWLLRLQRRLIDSAYTELYYWLYIKLFFGDQIDLVGKARVRIHPSTQLYLRDSKVIVENGVLSVGYHYLPLYRRECGGLLRLWHSTLRIRGNVWIRPGVEITAQGADVVIGDGTVLNERLTLASKGRVEIGAHCHIGADGLIFDYDFHKHALASQKPEDVPKDVSIKDHCWIGSNVTILKGVVIGEGSIVGAHSVVTRDVQPRTMVAGAPARIVKENVIWEP